ncbi:xanthine dehydrogenase family protein molybdopterin-binding subunit [Mesorhizobium sp. IMUNJ 23232]|uniref:xanthine dehydrogenase family protein molybdopterin-binding subunit n=1 Tax=Mesorhizobium sp. IMUNJ 23232 TaxID=3376064 RepID=UPI00378AD75D
MSGPHVSRRELLRGALIGGVAVYLAPMGSRAYASLFEDRLLTPPAWSDRTAVLKYRVDGVSKVVGEKVFARDVRARDMPHWPQQQAHALVLRVTKADRLYVGLDLSVLSGDLGPDRIVTAIDLARDGVAFPDFYGEDMLLPQGKTPAYLGHAVAILIYHDFPGFRFAKDKLQFNDTVVRYGAVTGPLERDPWGSSRFVRVGGATPYDEDVFSCMKQGPLTPTYHEHAPVWPQPARDGDVGAQGMYHVAAIDSALAHPPASHLVLTHDYATQSGDTAALEPDNANGWCDPVKKELHLVVASQSPQEVAEAAAAMLTRSRIGIERLFLHPCFTVGYGSKDHCSMPYYGLVAALYGDGRPVRIANDRFEQFQTGLKRHQFSMRYTMMVERETGQLQAFRADIAANGGGRANCSAALTMAGATAAQSVYYFPKSDVAATALSSRAIDCGSARGYGALETLIATELMIDEIAGELGLDSIEFRLRNVLKTGMKNGQGAIPLGLQRADEVLQKARSHPLWTGRVAQKQAYDAAHPGKYYGVGFGCIQRRFGTGAEASFARVEVASDGRISLWHTGTEIGTGMSSGQAVACVRWLGRPADTLDTGVTDWPDLPMVTSGDPHAMSQEEQDRLALDPRWTPATASASSASNSSYYFSHTTREATRVVFQHGLWPAAGAIWAAAGAPSEALRQESARWVDGSLTVEGQPPLPLAKLAAEAHARGLIVGAMVHGFNRWQWAEADFVVGGVSQHLPVDGLSVRYGDGAGAEKQAAAATPGRYHVLDRQAVLMPPTRNNAAAVGYNAAVGTLAELAVDAASGTVTVLTHHTILECGNMLVPDLVSSQVQGATASGIGLALHEGLPLYEDGPGDGTWNFNRYHLPRGSEVAVWTQTAEVLPPLSENEPPKGMAEVTMIAIIPAIVNGIAHAIGHRFRTLPVTPEQIQGVLS